MNQKESAWCGVEPFMREALYDPDEGYYTKHIRDVGARGDFTTGPALSPVLLARAVWKWCSVMRQWLGWDGAWHLIEVGPGSGVLTREICRLARRSAWHDFRPHMVESSPVLRDLQKRNLGRRLAKRVRIHPHMDAALDAAGGRALIFSNELPDAFPCRQLIRDQDRWREVGVIPAPGNGMTEEFRDIPANDPVLRCAQLADPGAREGLRVETHLSYRDWLRSWHKLWLQGAMLTIDYGMAGREGERRPLSGSLRAYFKQRILEGDEVFRRKGTQDITADVDFRDLCAWGRELGWRNAFLSTQSQFLRNFDPAGPDGPQNAFLTHPNGAGTAFLVLCQVNQPPLLPASTICNSTPMNGL